MELGERALIELEKVLADELNVATIRLAFNRRTELEGRYNHPVGARNAAHAR
jgi:hypothetical protein